MPYSFFAAKIQTYFDSTKFSIFNSQFSIIDSHQFLHYPHHHHHPPQQKQQRCPPLLFSL